MMGFRLSNVPIDATAESRTLGDVTIGAIVCFEGIVRDHNAGRAVRRLEYQAYAALAESEGAAIISEALARYDLQAASCVHRVGMLAIGDTAVWVGVSAAHRAAAFDACRYIIDAIKSRVPIWKNEHYAGGESGWLHPETKL